jgi:hypothetical protein
VLFDAVDVENVAAVAIDSLGAVVHEPAEVVALGPFSHKLVGGQVGKSLWPGFSSLPFLGTTWPSGQDGVVGLVSVDTDLPSQVRGVVGCGK